MPLANVANVVVGEEERGYTGWLGPSLCAEVLFLYSIFECKIDFFFFKLVMLNVLKAIRCHKNLFGVNDFKFMKSKFLSYG